MIRTRRRVLAAVAWIALVAGSPVPAMAVHASTETPLAIAPEDVQRYLEAGEVIVVIDLRPLDSFRQGHVTRAQSLPVAELRRRQAEIPRAGRVVLCGATPEEAAAAYRALRDAGYRNVMVLAGGFPAWTRLGLPVETTR
ncbi:MAG TPA: rhodanese-like domain-containing protein [Methylomirabilota bacterium]|jgi:rhodanese-related sulfurtransferase|nr:rhodanese-like domain-containing protein [Methylomirabilota bacterium]